jgi:hypothetical protein
MIRCPPSFAASWRLASIVLGGLAVDAPTDTATAISPQPSGSSATSGDAQVDTLQIAPSPDAGAPTLVASSAPSQRPAASSAAADGASDGLDPAIFACHADADCTAVRKNGCCNHGELEAVASSKVAAYKASFTCRTHGMCPQFLRRDLRVPVCDAASSRCQMVAPKP